jgi:hypothetical protein
VAKDEITEEEHPTKRVSHVSRLPDANYLLSLTSARLPAIPADPSLPGGDSSERKPDERDENADGDDPSGDGNAKDAPCGHTCNPKGLKACLGTFKLGRPGGHKSHMRNYTIHAKCSEECPGFNDVKESYDALRARRDITVVLPDILQSDGKAFFDIAGRSVDISDDPEMELIIGQTWAEHESEGQGSMFTEQYIKEPKVLGEGAGRRVNLGRVYDWVSRLYFRFHLLIVTASIRSSRLLKA